MFHLTRGQSRFGRPGGGWKETEKARIGCRIGWQGRVAVDGLGWAMGVDLGAWGGGGR